MKSLFASRLKEIRTERDLTLDECAKLLNTTKSAIWRYENAENTPSIDFVAKVSVVFRVSIDWLVGQSDNRVMSHLLEKELLGVYDLISEEGRLKIIEFAQFILQTERKEEN